MMYSIFSGARSLLCFSSNDCHPRSCEISVNSFDVTSLYTKLPITETIKAVEERLIENNNWKKEKDFENLTVPDITCLLTECLNNTYFQYNNELYLQNDGCPMGSPISGTVADIFLQKLEKHVIPKKPKNNFLETLRR